MVLSVSEERYEEFQKETKVDPELQAVLTMVRNGWLDKKQQVPLEARPTGHSVTKSQQPMDSSSKGPRSLNAEQSLDDSAHHNLPKDQTEQPAPLMSPVIPPAPQVSPVIPLPWKHHNPEPPEGGSSEAYVTRSGRQVLKPKRLDLKDTIRD